MGFLFGGNGGQTSSSNSNSTASTNYTPQYNDYVNNILSTAQGLGNTPFPAYDISKMFAPFQPDQTQAFNQVENNQNAYQPYIQSATGALNNVSGYNPVSAGMPYINQAGAGPTPYQAGSGNLSQSAQGWNNPYTQASYTNPFLANSVGYANQLASDNFLQKTMPGINNEFIASGGGFGSNQYGTTGDRAIKQFSDAMTGQSQTAAATNYWNGANQFNSDQSRMANAGTGLGSLAGSTMSGLGNLGQTAANITSGGVNTGAGLANAYSNLGGALSNLNLTNSNALLQVGNQQQQQAQQPLTAAYQQFQQGVQWPFQMVNFMNAAQRGLQIPTTQNTSSNSTNTQSSNSSPSALGGILGGLGSIMSIPGVASWTGGQLSDLFKGSGGGTSSVLGGTSSNPFGSAAQGAANTFGAAQNQNPYMARGGHVSGALRRQPSQARRFAAGGFAPAVRGMNHQAQPALRAIRAKQSGGAAPGMGALSPPSMSPMSPPIPQPGGALSMMRR
jgi:hypothetical protein